MLTTFLAAPFFSSALAVAGNVVPIEDLEYKTSSDNVWRCLGQDLNCSVPEELAQLQSRYQKCSKVEFVRTRQRERAYYEVYWGKDGAQPYQYVLFDKLTIQNDQHVFILRGEGNLHTETRYMRAKKFQMATFSIGIEHKETIDNMLRSGDFTAAISQNYTYFRSSYEE